MNSHVILSEVLRPEWTVRNVYELPQSVRLFNSRKKEKKEKKSHRNCMPVPDDLLLDLEPSHWFE